MTRKILYSIAVVIAVVSVVVGQTRVSLTDLRTPTTSNDRFMLLGSSGFMFAQFDGSIVIDKTTNPPTIRATSGKIETEEYFVLTTAQTSFALAAPPAGIVKVFRNGVRLSPVFDYTVSGSTVTILAAQGTAVGDNMLFNYMK